MVGNNELLRDESGTAFCSNSLLVYFASKHASGGGLVHLQSYLSMPHAFVLFEDHLCALKCYEELAKFVDKVTTGKKIDACLEIVDGKGVIVGPLDLDKYPVAFSKSEVHRYYTFSA